MSVVGIRRIWRWALAILLVIVTLLMIAFVALHIWFESTAGQPPKMFADVQGDFTDDGPWRARMTETFPTGTPEPVLLQRLRSEGFEVDPQSRSATYEWGNGIPCIYTMEVEWSADLGRVTASRARYSNACL